MSSRNASWVPLTSTGDRAISSTDDKQDSQTAYRFQSKQAFFQHHFMGIWTSSETDKAKKNDLGNSVWPLPSVEMLPRNLQEFHWNHSLHCLSEQNSCYSCHSGWMSSCCCPRSNQKDCVFALFDYRKISTPCCSRWQIRSFFLGLYHVTLVGSLSSSKHTLPKLSTQILSSPPTWTTAITSKWIQVPCGSLSLGPNSGSTTSQLCELRQMT